MNKKYQIFISSTYTDLVDERSEIIKSCLKMGYIPIGMEMFNAADEEQWQLIKRTIDGCDYYCVIVARRYGSRGSDGMSFTEMEFEYATSQRIPIIRFLLHEDAQWQGSKSDQDVKDIESLNNFKKNLKTKMVSFWNNKHDLAAQFVMSLGQTVNMHPRPGWIRSDGQSYETALAEISRLSSENDILRVDIKKYEKLINQKSIEENIIDDLKKNILTINGSSYPKIAMNKNNEYHSKIIIKTNLLSIFIVAVMTVSIGSSYREIEYELFNFIKLNCDANYPNLRNISIEQAIMELASRGIINVDITTKSVETKISSMIWKQNRTYKLTDLGASIYREIQKMEVKPEFDVKTEVQKVGERNDEESS